MWEIPGWNVYTLPVDLTPVVIMKHLETDVKNGGGTRTRHPEPPTQIGLFQPCVRVGKTTSVIDICGEVVIVRRPGAIVLKNEVAGLPCARSERAMT